MEVWVKPRTTPGGKLGKAQIIGIIFLPVTMAVQQYPLGFLQRLQVWPFEQGFFAHGFVLPVACVSACSVRYILRKVMYDTFPWRSKPVFGSLVSFPSCVSVALGSNFERAAYAPTKHVEMRKVNVTYNKNTTYHQNWDFRFCQHPASRKLIAQRCSLIFQGSIGQSLESAWVHWDCRG